VKNSDTPKEEARVNSTTSREKKKIIWLRGITGFRRIL